MDPRQGLARLAELKAEGDAIMQQLMAAGMPPEQIMAAVQGVVSRVVNQCLHRLWVALVWVSDPDQICHRVF